jgi:hypothetical protein
VAAVKRGYERDGPTEERDMDVLCQRGFGFYFLWVVVSEKLEWLSFDGTPIVIKAWVMDRKNLEKDLGDLFQFFRTTAPWHFFNLMSTECS